MTHGQRNIKLNIRENKAETESTVANLRQEINQSREQVDGLLKFNVR